MKILKIGILTFGIFALLITAFFLMPTKDRILLAQNIELACPSPLVSASSSFDIRSPSTGGIRQYFCIDQRGNLFIVSGQQDSSIVNATANGVVLDACRFGWTAQNSGLSAGARDCSIPSGLPGGTGNCSINSTSTVTCTTGAPFLPTDTGKKAWLIINAGATTACPYGTVTYVSSTVITLSTTCTQTSAQAYGWIGTDNTVALNAITANAKVNQHLFLGTGNMMVSDKILSNGFFSSINVNPYEIYGGGEATGTSGGRYVSLTNIVFPPFDFPYAGSSALIANNDLGVYAHDFSVDNGVSTTVSTAGGGFLVNFSGPHVDRIAVSNWNMSNYPCLYTAQDQQQISYPQSFGCAIGLKIASTNVTITQPSLGTGSATGFGLWNFDTSTVVLGGFVLKALSDNQGGHGTIAYYGTNFLNFFTDNALTTVSGSTTYLFGALVGGGKDCASQVNSTGLLNVSGGIVYASQTRFCSTGTGFSINNAAGGIIHNVGGNSFPVIGAGSITNSGTLIAEAGGESGNSSCAANVKTITFSNVYQSTPIITVSDETTVGGVRLTAKSATQFSVSCTGATDNFDYNVSPNGF